VYLAPLYDVTTSDFRQVGARRNFIAQVQNKKSKTVETRKEIKKKKVLSKFNMQEESTATTSTLATEEAESIGPLPINALEAHGVASGLFCLFILQLSKAHLDFLKD
jgi:hypothetical protein